MSAALLDVNILLALLDASHKFHVVAEPWFRENRMNGWATCAITEAGFVRISAQTSTPVRNGLSTLISWCETREHEFWPLDFPLSEMRPEIRLRLQGHNQLTDAILLDLAIRRGGRFVTFDRRVTSLLPEDSPHQNAIEVIAV